jgi:CRP-like cAMP-binding protein
MAVLDRAPRAANVTAIADVRALSIPGDGFRGLILERPELSRNIIGELTQRLRGMIAQQYGQQQPSSSDRPT